MQYIKRNRKYPNIQDIFIYIVLFFILSFLGVILSHTFRNLGFYDSLFISSEDAEYSIGYILGLVMVIIGVTTYRRIRCPRDVKIISIFRRHKYTPATILLLGVALILAADITTEPILRLFPSSLEKMYDLMSNMGGGTIITSIFIAPVVEELFFRGIIQSDLQQRYGPFPAILITSLFFGAAHLNIAQSISAIVNSLIICYIYYRTNSLWVVIFIHFINNLFAHFIFMLFNSEDSYIDAYREIINIDWLYNTLYFISLSAIVYIFYKIAKLYKNKEGN